LIARFYQKFSGEQTLFRLFILPLAIFGASAVRYASVEYIAGDTLADLLSGIGGAFLLILSLRLYQLMILKRQRQKRV
jgi:hypothetical protein